MSLLKEIIAEATEKSGDVPRMLRLCLVLAAKLRHEPLITWVRNELEGFPPEATLPAYRILRTRNRGHFVGMGINGILDIPISVLPKKLQPHYLQAEIRDGIGELAYLHTSTANGEGGLQMPWPVEVAVQYGSDFVNSAQCIKAWMELSPAELAGMIDKVKTKVLAFVLEIETEAPDAGEIESPSDVLKKERVSHIFNTTILGGVQNYSAGGHAFNQVTIGDVQAGDLDSLITALRKIGIGEDDIENLKDSVKVDSDSGSSGMGNAVRAWLGDIAIKTGKGIADIGSDVATATVVQILKAFFGLTV